MFITSCDVISVNHPKTPISLFNVDNYTIKSGRSLFMLMKFYHV